MKNQLCLSGYEHRKLFFVESFATGKEFAAIFSLFLLFHIIVLEVEKNTKRKNSGLKKFLMSLVNWVPVKFDKKINKLILIQAA